MGLTNKRRAFIEEYLRCWNATEAARRAGYANPRVMGSRLTKVDKIKTEIDHRITEKAMSANEVITRLAEQARGDIADSLKIDGNFVMVDMEKMKELGLTHLIKKFKQTKQGIEVEFYDAQAALVHLGKHHGLFNADKIGSEENPIRIDLVVDKALSKAYGVSD